MTNTRARVLIVDDDRSTTETFARMLRLEGHDVRTAPDAQRGLAAAHAYAPDAIIVDFRMSSMDGLDFIRRFRAEEGGRMTPIAMVTGDYFLDDRIMTELDRLRILLRFKPLWLDDLCTLAGVLLAAPLRPGRPTTGTREPGVHRIPPASTGHPRKPVQ